MQEERGKDNPTKRATEKRNRSHGRLIHQGILRETPIKNNSLKASILLFQQIQKRCQIPASAGVMAHENLKKENKPFLAINFKKNKFHTFKANNNY